MGEVMIKCPETGEDVPTGYSVAKRLFQLNEMSSNRLEACPACGQTHIWEKEDAWVDED